MHIRVVWSQKTSWILYCEPVLYAFNKTCHSVNSGTQFRIQNVSGFYKVCSHIICHFITSYVPGETIDPQEWSEQGHALSAGKEISKIVLKVSRNGIASIRARSESFIALKAPSCQSHYFYRYGTKGRRRWGDWHHMSKVTPAETGKIELDLEPELASDLITSLSSDNKWVDIYQTDRFRHLTLTHLSGNSNHGSKKLCFHWKA